MKSMTGYGAAEGKVGKGTVYVELKTLNHRYCDVQLKIPPKFNVIDPRIRKVIQSRIARGKVDLFIKEKRGVEPTAVVTPNIERARAYQQCLRQLARQLGGIPPPLLQVISLQELVRIEEPMVRYERYWKSIAVIVERALRQLERMRKAEGIHLLRDQTTRLRRLRGFVERIDRLVDQVVNAQQRAEMEGRMPIERLEITEEITRLQSHLVQYRRYCTQKGPIGRQLDFLLQEMNREINTIGSKGNNATISQLVVEAKSELEKLREQVQNIE